MKKWIGLLPFECDVCKCCLRDSFVDGKTVRGQWGILCTTCHDQLGIGLGTGRGQRYFLDTGDSVD